MDFSKRLNLKLIPVIFLSLLVVSCNQTAIQKTNHEKSQVILSTKSSPTPQNKQPSQTPAPKSKDSIVENTNAYNKDLAQIFPQKEGALFSYSGILDYGHKSKIEKVEKLKEKLTVTISGNVDDLSGGEAGKKENFIFKMKYIITKDSVIEAYDKLSKFPDKPVPDKGIILKYPIKAGTSWDSKFLYNNKTYIGNTKIEKVTVTGSTKKITTVTTINGIKEFNKRPYREIREYQSSKGLVSSTFSTTTEGFDFNYHLDN